MLIWSLSDGKAGHAAQAMALSRALAAGEKAPSIVPKTAREFDARLLPAFVLGTRWVDPSRLCEDCKEPWPDAVVSCGSRASSAALALKARRGAKAVCILRPAHAPSRYDAVVAPNHDRMEGENVISVCGSLVDPDWREKIAERAESGFFLPCPGERLVVLLGGPNKMFPFDRDDCSRLAQDLRKVTEKQGLSVIYVKSRRTPFAAIEMIQRELGEIDPQPEAVVTNAYLDAIAVADFLLVTGDSVNMLSEACAAGLPTYIYELTSEKSGAGKFGRFHRELEERGCARVFRGELERWDSPALDETRRAAAETGRLLAASRDQAS